MNARTWGGVALQPLVAESSITTRNTFKNEPKKLFYLASQGFRTWFSVA